MILKGNQRSSGRNLAAHLANAQTNEHVELHELRGFASEDLLGAFLEIEAAAAGTRCQQPFFSVSMNPPAGASINLDQFEMAAAAIEEKFPGLADTPRAFVFHEKEGRRHAHVVWSRIDPERGKAVPLAHSHLKLGDVSRALHRALDLKMPTGLRDKSKADPLNYDRKTWQQATRIGEDPRDLKRIIKEAWAVSDSRASFESALERHALHLARGDRRGYVVVHHSGESLSLSRYADLKKKDIEARIGKPDKLQTVDQVQSVLKARMTATAEKKQDDLKRKHARELKPHADRVRQMKERQRSERADLKARQATRHAKEELTRANRLRKGVMGLWDRISGKRGKVSEINRQEAAAGRIRDRDERQSLIDRHQVERREVQAQVMQTKARHSHEREYSRTELAVMMSMLKEQTRDDFQKHAQEIEQGIDGPGEEAQERDQDKGIGRDLYEEKYHPKG